MNYAVHMVLDGWIPYNWIIIADEPSKIYDKIYPVQDLNCLHHMGLMHENGKKAREGLNKLGEFLEKYNSSGDLKIEDYKLIDLDLSIGGFHITEIAKGNKAIETLKAAHPEAEVH